MSAIPLSDWGEAFNLYHSKVLSFIYRRTNNWHLAEDLTSDVFVRAINHSEQNEQTPDSFSGWVYRIANNLIIDYYRNRGLRTVVSFEDMSDIANPQDDPAREAEITLDREMLQGVLNRLTAEQAQALILRYQENCSIAEIAAEMGKPESAVKQLLFRGCEASNKMLRPGTARPPRVRGHQTEVMDALRERGPMTVGELAHATGLRWNVVNAALYTYPQTFAVVGGAPGQKRVQINVWGLVGVHDGNRG